MQDWDGHERRLGNDDRMGELIRELQALHRTTLEMHEENRLAADERRKDIDQRLGTIANNIHTLELGIARGDSQLHERIAVHEASPHHIGTLERLTIHERQLDKHEEAIGKLKQRIGTDDGRREAMETRSTRHYERWGLVLAVLAALVASGASLLGSWWQAAATFMTGGKTP